MNEDGGELSLDEQQEITQILEAYHTNPSNSNKYRFELFEYINGLLTTKHNTSKE